DELIERFADQAPRLWNALNDLFAYMPLAALVGGRILCMHGGLSRHLNSLEDILQIKRPLADPTQHPLACDLLWADPSPVPSFQGFGPNTERSVSCYFGEDVVAQTCERLKVDIIVRAHQVQLDGCSFFCRRRLITIFSAPMYCKEINNMGAIMQVTRDLAVGFMLLHVTTPGAAGGIHVCYCVSAVANLGREKFVERYRRAENVSLSRSLEAVVARSPAVLRDHQSASST
ncbi:serine/threonine protein phosphatase, partial [Aphelenchoides avenae]